MARENNDVTDPPGVPDRRDKTPKNSAPGGTDREREQHAFKQEFANAIPQLEYNPRGHRYFARDIFQVTFTNAPNIDAVRARLAALQLTVIDQCGGKGVYTVSLPQGEDLFLTIKRINDSGAGLFAEPCEIGFDPDPPSR